MLWFSSGEVDWYACPVRLRVDLGECLTRDEGGDSGSGVRQLDQDPDVGTGWSRRHWSRRFDRVRRYSCAGTRVGLSGWERLNCVASGCARSRAPKQPLADVLGDLALGQELRDRAVGPAAFSSCVLIHARPWCHSQTVAFWGA